MNRISEIITYVKMTPFNIPKKQLALNRWIPSYKKRKFYRVLKKKLCRDCIKDYDGYRYNKCCIEWDKIEYGDTTKKRCYYCKKCLAKNCCVECGSDYTDSGRFNISKDYCGYCKYLNKWGPNGYEYLALQEENKCDYFDDHSSYDAFENMMDDSVKDFMREYSETLRRACVMPKTSSLG